MKKTLFIFLIFSLIFSFTAFLANGEENTVEMIMPEDMPPASMKDNSEYPGLCIEIFQAICHKAGFQAKVTYEPWVRAQETVKTGKNLVIMGLGKTPQREKMYQWICPVYSTEWAFVSINGKAYDLKSAKSLGSVMIQSGTPMLEILTKAGYTNLALVPINQVNAKKLATGRGDVWVTTVLGVKWIWKKEGLTGRYTIGPAVWKNDQWMAISSGSDPGLADALKKGFNAIKADGTFDKIYNRYLK